MRVKVPDPSFMYQGADLAPKLGKCSEQPNIAAVSKPVNYYVAIIEREINAVSSPMKRN